MKSIYLRILLIALCASLWGMLPSSKLHADTTISTSQTQTGGVLTVAPPTLLITHPTNNPLLTLTGGATTTSGVQAVVVGNLNGDEGQLEINGGSLLSTTGNYSPLGTYGLTKINSGVSYLGLNVGSSGMATVSGTNSTWMNDSVIFVGHKGTGTLSIMNGGRVINNYEGIIGYENSSISTAAINGVNSTWTNNRHLFVGYNGIGMLTIQDGGNVSNTWGYIGYSYLYIPVNSTVIVSGANSTWTNSQELSVGRYSHGTLLVQNGGSVSNTTGYIGYSYGSKSTATVSGTNSTWANSQSLYIGGSDTSSGDISTLSISNGGKVTVANTTKIWNFATLNIDGGTLDTLHFDRRVGTVNHYDGTIKVTGNYQQSGTMRIVAGNAEGKNPLFNFSGSGTHSTIEAIVIGATGNTQNGQLLIDGGRTLAITGNGSTLTTLNGTAVVRGNSYLGLNSGSTGNATVSGTNSKWTHSGELRIGFSGTGTLSIQDGGSVSNTNGYIALYSTSNSTATVSGANSIWTNSQSLYIGGSTTVSGGVGALTISNGGRVTVAGTTKFWYDDTLNLNGGTLETDILEAANTTSRIVLTGNSNQIRIGSNSNFTGRIEGTGGFIKTGPGTLTLNNTNTFTGTIFVTEGMLNVQTSLPNNGPTSVSIPAPDNSLDGNPSLSRRRNINANYAGFGATSSGSLNTTLEIRAGTNLTGTDNSVIMQVRQRTLTEAQTSLFSDVFSLTGMVNNPSSNPDQTDLFVLQMSYDPTLVLDELQAARNGDLILGVLNETTGQWVNAVSTNIGGTPMFVGDRPWNSSYMTLGQYGVDTNANVVWAVINHNSQFAVVPEPSTWVAGTLTILGFSAAAIRRRRSPAKSGEMC